MNYNIFQRQQQFMTENLKIDGDRWIEINDDDDDDYDDDRVNKVINIADIPELSPPTHESIPTQLAVNSIATGISFVVDESQKEKLCVDRLASIDDILAKILRGEMEVYRFFCSFYDDKYRAYIQTKSEELGLFHKSSGTKHRVLHVSKNEIELESGSGFVNMLANTLAQIPNQPLVVGVVNQNDKNQNKVCKLICPLCETTVSSYRYLKVHYTRKHEGYTFPEEATIKRVD